MKITDEQVLNMMQLEMGDVIKCEEFQEDAQCLYWQVTRSITDSVQLTPLSKRHYPLPLMMLCNVEFEKIDNPINFKPLVSDLNFQVHKNNTKCIKDVDIITNLYYTLVGKGYIHDEQCDADNSFRNVLDKIFDALSNIINKEYESK